MRSSIVSLAAAAALASLSCRREASPSFTVEDLGIPRTSRVVQASAVLEGTLLLTLFETRGDNHLAVVDLSSGRAEELALAGSIGADALTADPQRKVAYVGASNRPSVWTFDPASRRLERIAALDPLLAQERYVWSVAVGPGGLVYAGTYPGGQLIEHDPATGRARSLGAPLAGRQYVRSLAVGASGTVYCGVGTPAAVVSVDPRTGRRRTLLETPASTFPGRLRLEDGALLAGAHRIRVADRAGAPTGAEPEVGLDGRYKVATAGRTYEGRVDLASRQDGMGIMSLARGPDGALYGATYYNASVFRVIPADGRLETLGRAHGADAEFRALQDIGNGRLLLPGYHGRLYVFDVGRPWGETNPRPVGEIGQGQHLALAADRAPDGRVALATPPDYGLRGGGLTILDPRSMTWRTLKAPVPEQAVVSVCFAGARVVAGTSIEAGPGESATATGGHVVTVDPETLKVLADVAPIPGATAITALAPLDDRRVLGGTDTGQLFTFDTATSAVQPVSRLPHIRDLKPWPGRDDVVGIGWRKGLFLVDRGTLAVSWVPGAPEKLVTGIAFDGEGRAYVHDGARVYRITRR